MKVGTWRTSVPLRTLALQRRGRKEMGTQGGTGGRFVGSPVVREEESPVVREEGSPVVRGERRYLVAVGRGRGVRS